MSTTLGQTATTLDMLKALADDRRLALVRLLAGRELCVCEIAGELGMSDALVSHHLKRLRAAGLVTTRRVGQWLYCCLEPGALQLLAAQVGSLAVDAGTDRDEGPGDSPRPDIKYIDACGTCGFSFYMEAKDPAAEPQLAVPCPQCGASDARFTFKLGGSCQGAGC